MGIDKIMNISDEQVLMDRENELEDKLEELYWEFDSEVKKGNRSDRDIFKGKMRFYAKEYSSHKDMQINMLKIISK